MRYTLEIQKLLLQTQNNNLHSPRKSQSIERGYPHRR